MKIDISKFLGMAPIASPLALGDGFAQVAIDCDLRGGVLTIYANADAGAFTSSGTKTLAECSVTYTRV